ncbi:cupin domain-containing protein [Myxococcus sp. K15C18031901]|uniref:cupin domain-containing protein n=1 Tax=Myxococcus dinghuensis TaxID=2906761 RepID=UPI0020A758A7|nr:cupin domain-containing protein [Myxococcus dinghuensis]MCP3098369.1 cupin domain-containing protein [Myxococcus dinghuensis]
MSSHPHVVHEPALPWTEVIQGPRVTYRRKQLGAAAKGQKLGCSLMELPPGKHAWPLHYHLANEEAYFILSGSGRLRLGETSLPVKAGDYVALPAGAGTAHQLINDGDAPLRYLAFSTMLEPDVMVYPDSRKVVVTAGSAPGGDKATRTLYTALPLSAEVDYWSGEER